MRKTRGRLVRFDVADLAAAREDLANIRRAHQQAKRARIYANRAGGLTKDLVAVSKKQPREKDRAGRPKQREWERAWAKDAALTGGAFLGIAAAAKFAPGQLAKARLMMRGTDERLGKMLRPGRPPSAPPPPPTPSPRVPPPSPRRSPSSAAPPPRSPWVGQRLSKEQRRMPEVLRGHPDAWREQGRRRGAIKRRKGYDRDRVKKQAAEIGLATLPGRDVVLHFAAQDPTRREILTVEGREIGRVQDARGNSFRVYTKAAGERQRRKKRPEERIEAERARHQRDKVVSGVASGLGALGLTAGGALVAHRLRLRQVRRQHGEQVEGLNAALRKAKGERISQGKRSKAQARADEAQAARDQGTMVDLPVPGLGKKKA